MYLEIFGLKDCQCKPCDRDSNAMLQKGYCISLDGVFNLAKEVWHAISSYPIGNSWGILGLWRPFTVHSYLFKALHPPASFP